jgi:hypothetical protein
MDNLDDKTLAGSGSSRSQEQPMSKKDAFTSGFEDRALSQPGLADLQDQIGALRHLAVSILILLVVISGTFTIYLLRQWRTVNKELAGFRPQATQLVGEYQRVSAPVMSDFVKKVTEYGRTHPDFMPVLAKYGLKPGSSTGAAPVTATAPPPAVPKK